MGTRAGNLKFMLLAVLLYLFCVRRGNGRNLGGDHGRGSGHNEGNWRGNNNGEDRGNEGYNGSGLREGYYRQLCPSHISVEEIVRSVVKKYMDDDSTLAASLLRLQFHDCFLRGCDASVLLAPTATNQTEMKALANGNLRGFEVIEDAKQAVEDVCPGVVSCADILVLSTRDAVDMLAHGSPYWQVRTGRRDGLVSLASETTGNIPSSFANFSQLKTLFQSKGFSVRDLVILSGAHTIGVANCGTFSRRLYNFSGNGDSDPSLDRNYAEQLKVTCKPGDSGSAVAMDPGSQMVFDNDYYVNLQEKRGLLTSDAALLTDGEANNIVNNAIGSEGDFLADFVIAMEKLVELDVITGKDGEIRQKCASVN